MYFDSRVDAGQRLADAVSKKYSGQDCAVVGLSDGGVMVGAQIALKLGCVLTMMLSETIELPREETAIAGISHDGALSYNSEYSPSQIDYFLSEYRNVIEQEKLVKMRQMHRAVGKGGLIRRDLLQDRNIILVSDGLSSSFSLDLATEFLKPIHIKRVIVATPFASLTAVDRMHILADDIFCLNVLSDYISTDHYYDTQDVPPHEQILKTVEHVVSHWKG